VRTIREETSLNGDSLIQWALRGDSALDVNDKRRGDEQRA
jgi:hypothetical protein